MTWTSASTSAGAGVFTNSFAATHGDLYVVSGYVRSSIAQKMRIGIDWRNSSGNIFAAPTGPVFTIPAYDANLSNPTGRDWTRIYFACPAPRTAVNGFPTFFDDATGTRWPAGSWLDLDGIMIEQLPITRADVRVNHYRNPNHEYAFQGMNGLNATVTADTAWAASGTRSVKITPNGASTDSCCGPDYDAGDFRFGMVPGKTYTFSADVRLAAAQTGTLHPNARSLCIYYRTNAVGYVAKFSAQAPNAAGVTRLSVTQTIPADATEAFIRVYNGSNSAADPMWYDLALLEEGTMTRPYFDASYASTQFYKYNWGGSDPAWAPSLGYNFDQFFDGSTGAVLDPAYDQVAAWEGTAGLSTSVVRTKPVPLYFMGNSNAYSARSATAVSVVPNGTSNDTFVSIEGDTGAFRHGMAANKTYTVKAKIYISSVQTGTLHANARTIRLFYKASDGQYYAASSTPAPNTVGEHDLTLSVTIPAGATEAFVRLYNGASFGGGVVSYSKIMVSETAGDYFDGSMQDTNEFDYSWAGTMDASASILKTQTPVGAVSGGSTQSWLSSALDFPDVLGEYFARWHLTGPGNAVGIYLNDFTTVPAGNRTAWMRVRASRTMSVQPRWRTLAGVATVVGSPVVLQQDQWTTIEVKVTNAPADTQLGLLIAGGAYQTGDTIDIGRHFHIPDADYTGGYFDGSTDDPDYSGWNGAANASTSYKTFSALSVTVYDYEARQGLETDYIITSDGAALGESVRLTIPSWGTWLKDPFRPHMNTKVYWGGDSDYVRKSDRVLLKAKGAKYPVAQWDTRQAPSGNITIVTDTNEMSSQLIALLDEAGVVMIDVDLNFGVPVRYVSVGDVTGSRVGPRNKDLGWEARQWDLPVDEVDYPIGSPVGQGVTYDSIDAQYGSYLAIPVDVLTYDDLAAGTWRQ
jgi:hypothetical protein